MDQETTFYKGDGCSRRLLNTRTEQMTVEQLTNLTKFEVPGKVLVASIWFLSSVAEDCYQSSESKRKPDSVDVDRSSKRVKISKLPTEKVVYEGVDLEVDDVEFVDVDERMNTVSEKATKADDAAVPKEGLSMMYAVCLCG